VSGGQLLEVYYEGPGVSRRLVDPTVLFTVPRTPLRLLSPCGGERFSIGDTLVVRYTADQAQVGDGVVVELSLDDGESWDLLSGNSAIAFDDPSFGVFPFVIPSAIGERCAATDVALVRVRSYMGPYLEARSAAPFSITNSAVISDPRGTNRNHSVRCCLRGRALEVWSPGRSEVQVEVMGLDGRTVLRQNVTGSARIGPAPTGGAWVVRVRDGAREQRLQVVRW